MYMNPDKVMMVEVSQDFLDILKDLVKNAKSHARTLEATKEFTADNMVGKVLRQSVESIHANSAIVADWAERQKFKISQQ